MTDRLTMTPVEAAHRLGEHVTPAWLIKQARTGKFPGRKIGRHWVFTEADLQSILDITYRPHIEQPRDGLTPTTRRRMRKSA